MSSQNKLILSRKELYDLVWSNPLTTLAKEYGMSDNGLRKICVKHNIPLPIVGHWAKVKHGKKVKKTPLTRQKNQKSIEINIRAEEREMKPHINSELHYLKKEIENDKKYNLIVLKTLKDPDLLIEKAEKQLRNRKPKSYDNNRISTGSSTVSISITQEFIDRAICFMDAFVKLMKARGHTVKGSSIIVYDEVFIVRFRETFKRVQTERYYSELKNTGILSLKLDSNDRSYSHIKEWKDSSKTLVEDKLSSIVAKIEIESRKKKQKRIELAELHRQQEESRRQREELDFVRDQIRKTREGELSNFKELLDAATRWDKAEYLRNFISKVEENNQINSSFQKSKEWIEWAKAKADWYDPLIEKDDLYLKGVNRDSLELPLKKNSWSW